MARKKFTVSLPLTDNSLVVDSYRLASFGLYTFIRKIRKRSSELGSYPESK